MGATYEVNISGEITYTKSLSGEISAHYYEGSFIPIKSVTGEVTVPDYVTPETYDGEYEWTPSWETQTANTAYTYLTSNMYIKSIPLYEVSNEHGGITLTI